jgi:hypothetical protein
MEIRPITNYLLPITNYHGASGIISTLVESALQIRLFMQNKPNFRKSQMNVTDLFTREYEQKDTWWSGKNKANSNPIQSQYKANTKPIQTQTNPISNYSCVFELDLYNLVLSYGNLTNFYGEYVKWQMLRKQMQ